MKRAFFLLVVLLLMVSLSSCTGDGDSYLVGRIGNECKVQFKRNCLGGACTLPVGPTADTINNASVELHGALQAVQKESIVIEGIDPVGLKFKYWIPKDSILLVQFIEVQKQPVVTPAVKK